MTILSLQTKDFIGKSQPYYENVFGKKLVSFQEDNFFGKKKSDTSNMTDFSKLVLKSTEEQKMESPKNQKKSKNKSKKLPKVHASLSYGQSNLKAKILSQKLRIQGYSDYQAKISGAQTQTSLCHPDEDQKSNLNSDNSDDDENQSSDGDDESLSSDE